MMWVFAILIVLAMGSIAVIAAGRGTPMQDEYDDRPDAFVPAEDDLIGPGDLKAVRFSLAVRGYRMSEVDALLSRLATQLEESNGAPVPLALPAPAPAAATDPAARPADEPAPPTGAAAPARPEDRTDSPEGPA
ncbi:DivIVA domain-containing protein [Nocardioides nematodiphilus]|uniref:DivIVA domain-containing protein n=1 Tax=Nocardioides nematodiphilus TaxID=2849669 RepID=UPI001CD92952|nr:DivIVA domain-containing protein [Nocardioides nematodiphilus]MCA1982854.1 DivIVA domain-containing protein [Nocardioides nematodiphilus]